MEIKGKVWCMFEQSGTFKNEFKKIGIDAVDLDIQNAFNETDYVKDLFAEIEAAYDGKESIFDKISNDDLVLAFFPCTYFCCVSQINFSIKSTIYKNIDIKEAIEKIIKRIRQREIHLELLHKLVGVSFQKKLRLIIESPYSMQCYLKGNFIPPTYIDKDRSKRGDFRIKPTAYWFFNCNIETGFTRQQTAKHKILIHNHIKGGKEGQGSIERSLISNDYARNFIHDFVLGKSQPNISRTLFD